MGISFGRSVQLLAVCAGLGAVFARWPDLQAALCWMGAAYLLYLGMQISRSGPAGSRTSVRPLTFVEGAALQFLNPTAWIMTMRAATLFLPRQLSVLAAGAYMLGIMVVSRQF